MVSQARSVPRTAQAAVETVARRCERRTAWRRTWRCLSAGETAAGSAAGEAAVSTGVSESGTLLLGFGFGFFFRLIVDGLGDAAGVDRNRRTAIRDFEDRRVVEIDDSVRGAFFAGGLETEGKFHP